MRRQSQMSNRSSGPLEAAIYGAVIALALAYVLAYFVTMIGVGNITASAQSLESGPAALARTGLNLYAMQHVPLIGSGRVTSQVTGTQDVTASITLPLTVWIIVPILALLIGGFATGKFRASAGRWGVTASAILCGILYAGVLAAASGAFKAGIDPSALPSAGGVEFNPFPIAFRPSASGAFVFGSLFGIIFAYLGALTTLRGRGRDRRRGKWWACCKAIVLVALSIHLIMTGAVVWWIAASEQSEELETTARLQAMLMSPSAAGLGYALLQGASLYGGVESPVSSYGHPYSAELNLYTGTHRADQPGKTSKIPIKYLYMAASILAVAAMISGWLSVRWGSRDGSIPSAARLTFIHTAYLAIVMAACNVSWTSRMGAAHSRVFGEARFETPVLFTALGLFVFSLLGAYIANLKYIHRGGYPNL